MNDVMRIGSGDATAAERLFLAELLLKEKPRVLEMGTLRWEEPNPTHHRHWAPNASEYIMTDIEGGTDVDVVADAHTMSRTIQGRFDAVIAVSVWEHLRRPWVAAQEVGKLLRPGGIVFICTHQTFPLHGYPHDYFRFSDAALAGIFEDAGLVTMEAGYQYRAHIIPPDEVTRWNAAADAFLNVAWMGKKPDAT